MLRLFSAAIIAVLLLVGGAGSAAAATLEDILAVMAPIKEISPGMLKAKTTDDGRKGYIHHSPDDGVIFSAFGPASDVDEVQLIISLTDENGLYRVLSSWALVGTVTESDAAVEWAKDATKDIGSGRKSVFNGREVHLREVSRNVLWVSITKADR